MIVKLSNLKMIAIESVIDYITCDEKLQSNLREVDELREPMLISFILKGLKDDFVNFVTICKFGKDGQNLDSFKEI